MQQVTDFLHGGLVRLAWWTGHQQREGHPQHVRQVILVQATTP
ncbi:hypothetical protein OHA71_02710 [Streptomyces sp. NBC_00444]